MHVTTFKDVRTEYYPEKNKTLTDSLELVADLKVDKLSGRPLAAAGVLFSLVLMLSGMSKIGALLIIKPGIHNLGLSCLILNPLLIQALGVQILFGP